MSSVDVNKIMNEIRSSIVESGKDKEPLSFTDKEALASVRGSSTDIQEAIDFISCNYEIQPYEVLHGNKIVVFVKRVIRKLTGFFILPIVRQQNTLNYYYYRVSEIVGDVKADNEELLKRIENAERRIDELEKDIKR